MKALPQPLQELVDTALIRPRRPAFLLIDAQGCLLRWGGCIGRYGLQGMRRGQEIGIERDWLHGLIPLQKPLREEYLFLPLVQVDGERVADLLLTEEEEGVWILLLEASEEERQLGRLQQQANEFDLFKEKLGKGFAEFSGEGVDAANLENLLDLPPDGAVKKVAILAGIVRKGSHSPTETSHGEQLEALDLVCRSMARICRQHGGVVEEGWGGRLTAVFGLLPAGEVPAEQAVNAALEAGESIRGSVSYCGLSAGIATGETILGIVGYRRRILRVVGEPEERAIRLAGMARSGEIAIDGSTFTASGSAKRAFAACPERSESSGEMFVWRGAERGTDGSSR